MAATGTCTAGGPADHNNRFSVLVGFPVEDAALDDATIQHVDDEQPVLPDGECGDRFPTAVRGAGTCCPGPGNPCCRSFRILPTSFPVAQSITCTLCRPAA